MVDESDLSRETKWFYEERARVVIRHLLKKNMNGRYVSDRKEALSTVMSMIPDGVAVCRGDSVSLEQIGVIDELRKRTQIEFIDGQAKKEDGSYAVDAEERDALYRQAFTADVFVTGTNAITLDGKLVNIDGHGCRVAPLIFGPKKVVVVVGANKIARDLDEALERVRQIAAPINAQRHYIKHHLEDLAGLPCQRTGKCIDCLHEYRICRATVIIDGSMPRFKGRINVVLVGEQLGI
ncbi:MAG: lactate utilization protein [Chloroflexota bacterium]|nr:MAG: lactate utilization protein [Chloroflexota bacterium]